MTSLYLQVSDFAINQIDLRHELTVIPFTVVKRALFRPLQIMAQEPILMVLTLYMSLVYGELLESASSVCSNDAHLCLAELQGSYTVSSNLCRS